MVETACVQYISCRQLLYVQSIGYQLLRWCRGGPGQMVDMCEGVAAVGGTGEVCHTSALSHCCAA